MVNPAGDWQQHGKSHVSFVMIDLSNELLSLSWLLTSSQMTRKSPNHDDRWLITCERNMDNLVYTVEKRLVSNMID